MKLNPYLVMPGTTREALEFYSKALDGKIIEMNEFGDMPGILPEAKKLIIHGALEFNGNFIMFSDAMPNQEVLIGDNVTLSVNVNTVKESQNLYNALKEGGQVILELQETFWSKSYAQIKDRYNINWQINTIEK